jgi:hypothetical protein
MWGAGFRKQGAVGAGRRATHGRLILNKQRINAITLAPEAEFRRDSELFGQAARQPEFQRRTSLLLSRSLQTRGETELNLGHVLGGLEN